MFRDSVVRIIFIVEATTVSKVLIRVIADDCLFQGTQETAVR